MSYLNGPRINFWGGGSTNVDTANNEQYESSGSKNPIVDLIHTKVTSTLTDDEVIRLLRSPTVNSAGQPYFAIGGWNYDGDHQFALMNAKVSSSGFPGAISAAGNLTDLPVYLLGSLDPVSGEGPYGSPVMVDLDPTSSETTQIYAGGLLVGSMEQPALLIQGNSVCHSRMLGLRYGDDVKGPYLTPGSIKANGTFQLAFEKSAIKAWDKNNPLLRQMIEDSRSQGILVRFSMFQFFPAKDSDSMQKNYQENRNEPNPSVGRIIGTIGPWYANEPATDLAGRHLVNKSLGGAQGVALFDERTGVLSLDLVSALQGSAIRNDGNNYTSPPEPNIDYGKLMVSVGGRMIAEMDSQRDSYYLSGGIYDVKIDPPFYEMLKRQPLSITSERQGLNIQELPLRISSDQRNIYCDPYSEVINIHLRIDYLGAPPREDTVINLSTSSPGTLPDGSFLQYPSRIIVPAGRQFFTFTVTTNADRYGFSKLTLATPSSSGCEMSFRKYPRHDYSTVIRSGDIPWKLVYEECLRFYYVLFPAMSKRIPLNDEATIRAVGNELLKRLSEPYRHTTLYMPLTRSLSPGKVALLRAFLQQTP